MTAVASTSTPPQSMIRTDLDASSSMQWTPLTPSSCNDSKRITLPPIRTLLNEQLSYRDPAPNSASSSTTSSSFKRKLNYQSSPILGENALPSPASSSHRNIRKPIIPSHSASASPLMDLHDCIVPKHSSRRRVHHHHHHHYHHTNNPSSPYSYDHRRPSLSSLSQSSHCSSSYLDSNIPSPTQTTDSTSPDSLLKSQRAASWVSQFSLQMSMNSASNKNTNNGSPLASPISSASSGYVFPGPLNETSRRPRQDTNDTIKEEPMAEQRSSSPPPPPPPPPTADCTPMYSSVTSPPPSSASLHKKQSCAFVAQKRLWELPLCGRK